MNELHLFAGAGGGILAGQMLGHRCVCAVEWESYAAGVLIARQNDGSLPPFPVWDDVQTFDGRPWRGIVDIVAGGFPCQDISVAGKGAGITGERSGMWSHMARIVGEVRPRYVFVENSPALLTRGLGVVLGDLAALGYDCKWTVLGAADVGAPHQRDRLWIIGEVADTEKLQRDGGNDHAGISARKREVPKSRNCCRTAAMADAKHGIKEVGRDDAGMGRIKELGTARIAGIVPWEVEPAMGRVVDGVESRMDRLKAIGNGQVPLCAATAWRILTGAA